MDRGLLLNRLVRGGVNDRLVRALRNFFDETNLNVDEERVDTNIGVVQGGITSPLTFNVIIDPLIRELNRHGTCYALADDLVVHAKSEKQLRKIAETLMSETAKLSLEVSKEKSAVMEIQRGYRRLLNRPQAYGFPVVQSYKYLGVVITGKLQFEEDLAAR